MHNPTGTAEQLHPVRLVCCEQLVDAVDEVGAHRCRRQADERRDSCRDSWLQSGQAAALVERVDDAGRCDERARDLDAQLAAVAELGDDGKLHQLAHVDELAGGRSDELDALIAGEAVSADQSPSVGCSIKWRAD